MVEENISQEFRLKNIDDTRNNFLEEIEQNELISKMHRKVCATQRFVRASAVTGCIYISAFASLIGIAIGITSSTKRLKICSITAGIKKYKSIIKKKKKKHNKIVLSAKSKLNSAEVLIPKALIDSNISYYEFVLINNVLKEYHDMKEQTKKFCKKELQKKKKKKKNQKEFRLENVMKRKGDKLYVKWKGYDSSFNSWIDKKDIV